MRGTMVLLNNIKRNHMFKKLFLMLLFVSTFFSATPLNANALAPTEESVAELYIAYFDRAADSAGLEYWLRTNMSIEDISKSFSDQNETKEKYPENFSNADFIIEVYDNLFGRAPDSAGFDYWQDELDSGRISRNLFILAVVNGARGEDAMLLDNKTEVALAFAHDGRSDYDESIEILEDVTADHQTVLDTLCEYDLGSCPVKNPPVANAGPDQMTVTLGSTVTLDGSASADSNSSTYPDLVTSAYSDSDADPLTYKWTMTTKPIGSSATLSGETTIKPTFVADKYGGYVIDLVVNNGTTDSTPSSVTVTPDGSNVPIANAGPDQNDVAYNGVITLDGSASSAPGGVPLTYKWTISTKPEGSTTTLSSDTVVKPTFTPDKYGSYKIDLVVNDGTASSVKSSVVVTTGINNSPTANAGSDQNNVPQDKLVTLDGSASQDPNGKSLTYKWTMTTKPVGSTATLSIDTIANPAFTPDEYGSYTIELVVNNGTVSSVADSVTVTTIEDPRIIWPTDGSGKEYLVVVSPHTGETWLDRNMGADQLCGSSNDAGCYGDYYQWGRATDGHEVSTSTVTNSLAGDVNNVGTQFISDTSDWAATDIGGSDRSTNWSKLDGSSVCPNDFRLPSKTELAAETTDVGVSNITTAFESFLKIPAAGTRDTNGKNMLNEGTLGYLWSSSSESDGASGLKIEASATWGKGLRSSGASVRCIKD